jgi:hypothetical protein
MNMSKKTYKLLRSANKLATWLPIHMMEMSGPNLSIGGPNPIEDWLCSRCKETILYTNDGRPSFDFWCPHCGTYMMNGSV